MLDWFYKLVVMLMVVMYVNAHLHVSINACVWLCVSEKPDVLVEIRKIIKKSVSKIELRRL